MRGVPTFQVCRPGTSRCSAMSAATLSRSRGSIVKRPPRPAAATRPCSSPRASAMGIRDRHYGPRAAERERRRLLDTLVGRVPRSSLDGHQWAQFHHYGLDGMLLEELRREHQQVAFRLLFDDDPDPWWRERLNMVADELASR